VKLVGIMPVRNEAWCLGLTLRVALKWCDEVCVLLHHCTDESLQIVADVKSEVTDRLGYVIVPEDSWDEMAHRQKLLECARGEDATHIAIVDADEFITGNLLNWDESSNADAMHTMADGCPCGAMLELPGYNLRDVCALMGDPRALIPMAYHASGVWGNRWFATAFRDWAPAHWAGDRFHHRAPMGIRWLPWRPIKQGEGGTLHLWGASERRLRAKHALYKITERLRWPSKTTLQIEYDYDPATNPNSLMAQQMRCAGPWTFAQVPSEWIEPYADLMRYLDVDAEPWQEAEVRLLLQKHGREMFRGLDLLGY
jgi:Glycosyl transferase family 2